MDCLKIARANPDRKVVFFAIGFETTAPANAMSVFQRQARKASRISRSWSHMCWCRRRSPRSCNRRSIACRDFSGPATSAPSWVIANTNRSPSDSRCPIVITGFEPIDILEGELMTVRQLETGEREVENQYSRVVKRDGNVSRRNLVNQVFEMCDRKWRGIGSFPRAATSYAMNFAITTRIASST